MSPLTLFGLFAVTAMLVCYAMEERSPWWVLGFAFSCALGSVYGFLQGGMAFRAGRRHLGHRGLAQVADQTLSVVTPTGFEPVLPP